MLIKALFWNINQKGDTTSKHIYGEIKKQIKNNNADIIVLAEFIKKNNYRIDLVEPLENDGYVVFLDPRPYKDNIKQILIAIDNKFIINQEIQMRVLDDNEGNIFNEIIGYPNFLEVDITINNIPLSIIGTRIRIGSYNKNSRDIEHKRRQIQFDNLLQVLPKDRYIIMLGDFNISNHDKFKGERKNWHYDKHYITGFKNLNMVVCAPDKGYSPIKSIYKLDHLVVNNSLNIEVLECEYYPNKLENHINNQTKKIYSDHAMLLTKIELK